MSQSTILTAQTLGYFRAKKPESKAAILAEMLQLQEFADIDEESVKAILEAETMRRHVVSQQRAARQIQKAQADAAKPLVSGVDSATAHVTEHPQKGGKFVVTAAQNNTEVDPSFMAALLRYCQENGAQLLVAKITYNKNGFQQSQDTQDGIFYAPEVLPFLVEGQIDLGGIHFCAQANVLPTAKNPLSGFEAITPVGVDVLIPASKISMKCLAALKNGRGKILHSTGTVTKRNYIVRKAGAVAASEHNIGALIVDTSGKRPVVRQLELMPGSTGFYDEGVFYTAEGSAYGANPEAIQFGDIHAEKMDPANMRQLIRIIDNYGPENVILHDVMDFSSRNHHNIKDCAFMFAQHVKQGTVKGDICSVTEVLDTLASVTKAKLHIIESNHDLAINTWLKNTDFKLDPVNALVYLECMAALYKHIQETGNSDFNMLEFAYHKIGGGEYQDQIIFHATDESVVIAGIEMGCHGHTGTNGSKGSPAQFRALGVPMNTGHTHTPSILGGCYTAGVAGSLEMGYNIGASSWQLAHIVTWPNGQRQIIFND